MSKELLKPIEKEIELYDEDSYRQWLDECYGTFKIGCCEFDASRILEELDPIAFNVGLSDIQEYKTVYECPVCGTEHEEEEDALYCCQEEDKEEK